VAKGVLPKLNFLIEHLLIDWCPGHGLSSLDLQALLFLDSRAGPAHRELLEGAQEVMNWRPMILSSLKDCYLYWQLIMRHCYHFIAAARSELPQPNSTFSTPEPTNQGATFQHGINAWCRIPDTLSEVPLSLVIERDACIDNVHRWERVSKVLIEEALSLSKDSDAYIVAGMLRIQVAMTKIALGTAFSQNEVEYDNFTSEFNTITTFSEAIHPTLLARDTGSRFYFNFGILPGLCQVGMWCRQKAIRARAISLLQRSPEMQEGVWNSESLGQFVNFLRTVEEDGADEDRFLLASKRVSWIGSSISLYEKIAQVRLVQRGKIDQVSVKGNDYVTVRNIFLYSIFQALFFNGRELSSCLSLSAPLSPKNHIANLLKWWGEGCNIK